MANQTHPVHAPAQPKADPKAVAPEQHDAPPPPPQIEMGGSGTAKASFKDAAGGDVQIATSEWTSTGPVKVTADDKDATSAKIEPTGLGPATITVTAQAETGSAQASTSVTVIDKVGAPVSGTIEIAVQAPAAAAKAK